LAEADWLLFCDDDIEIAPADLERLWRARDSTTCIVPVAWGPNGELYNAYTLQWRFFDPKWKRESQPVPLVAFPVGLCFLLHRDRYWDAGGFDERIVPNYFEDTAFGFQLARTGVKVRMVEDAQAIHHKHSLGDARHLERIRPILFENRWVLCAVALSGSRRLLALTLGAPRVLVESARRRSLGPLVGYLRAIRRLPLLVRGGVLVRPVEEKLEASGASITG